MISALADLLAPPRCALCGRAAGPLCAACREELRPASPAPPPTGVERLLAAFDYEGPARALVLALKLRGERAAAPVLAEAMAAVALSSGLSGRCLTWVPGRAADLRRRGFDHAEVLARALAARLGLPARPLLARSANRPDQTALSGAERRRNLRGAFVARSAGEPVVLVDDVLTTGATAEACSAALRSAGATSVEVVVACRVA